MFKKLGVLALLVVFAFSTLASLSVAAVATQTLSDNFDNASESNIVYRYGDFYASNATNPDDGFLVPKTSTWSSGNLAVTDGGYNGTKGLLVQVAEGTGKYTDRYRMTGVMTRAVNLPVNGEAVLRYHIKFLALPTGGTPFIMSGVTNGAWPDTVNGHYASYSTTYGYQFNGGWNTGVKTDRWYTVVSRVTGTGATKTMSVDIVDESDGTILQSSNDLTLTGYTADAAVNFFPFYIRDNNVSIEEELKVVLDDISLSVYATTASPGLDYNSTSLANQATEVELQPTIDVAFDQRIDETTVTTSNIKLYKTRDSSNPVAISISKTTLGGFSVKPAANLDFNTNYTLDCSGIKNAGGVAIDSGASKLTFTTMRPTKSSLAISEDFNGDSTTYALAKQFNASDATENFAVVEGGRGVGKALKFTGEKQYYRLGYKRPADATAETFSEGSFDLRLSKLPTRVYDYSNNNKTGNAKFMIFHGSDSGGTPIPLQYVRKIVNGVTQIWLTDGTNDIKQITTEDWIRVKWFMPGNSNGPSYIEIYDANGDLIYNQYRGWDTPQMFMIGTEYGTSSDAEILLDNIYFNSYSAAEYGPSVMKTSLSSGTVDVPLATNSVTVELDQPLSTLAATLTPAGGTAVNCTVTLKENMYRTYVISWPGSLTGTTQYTLSLAGSKNAQNVAVDATGNISFTTLDPAKEPVAFTGATFVSGGSFTNGATQVDLKEGFVLKFDSAIATPVANETILIYASDDETQTPVPVTLSVAADKKSVTVTPVSSLQLNKTYVLDFSAVKSESEGVLNSETKTLAFTTIENRSAVYDTEDFEGYANGTKGSVLNSNVLLNTDDSKIVITIEDGAGVNGSKGLRAVISNGNPSVNGAVVAKTYDIVDGEYLYYEYKLKIDQNNPTKSNGIVIGGLNGWTYNKALGKAGHYALETGADGHYMSPWGSGNFWFTYDPGTWFTIVQKIGKADQTYYVFDEAGRILLEYTYTNAPGSEISLALVGTNWATAEFCIDDVKIYRTSNHALAFAETPSYDGKAVTVAFNEPMMQNPAHDYINSVDAMTQIELYDGNNKVAAKVVRTGMNSVQLIPERPLKDNYTYRVVYPVQTSLSQKSMVAGSVNFTTEKAFDVHATSANLVISGKSVASGAVSVGLQNSGSAVNDAVLIVALYAEGRPDTLVGLETANVSVAQGTSSVEVALDKSYSGVDYAVIMLYNSSGYAQMMQGLRID